jgi:hypothetical protein
MITDQEVKSPLLMSVERMLDKALSKTLKLGAVKEAARPPARLYVSR